jgi:hypothetical protein
MYSSIAQRRKIVVVVRERAESASLEAGTILAVDVMGVVAQAVSAPLLTLSYPVLLSTLASDIQTL